MIRPRVLIAAVAFALTSLSFTATAALADPPGPAGDVFQGCPLTSISRQIDRLVPFPLNLSCEAAASPSPTVAPTAAPSAAATATPAASAPASASPSASPTASPSPSPLPVGQVVFPTPTPLVTLPTTSTAPPFDAGAFVLVASLGALALALRGLRRHA